jgi:hypothetical protein
MATPFDDWAARARILPIEGVARHYNIKLRASGAELIGPCPQCGGDDRFAINKRKNVFNCRGCNTAGDTIALEMFLGNADFNTAVERLTGMPPPKKANGNGKAHGEKLVRRRIEYPYTDESGNVLFVVVRDELLGGGKEIRQKTPAPDGSWVWKRLEGTRNVPYRLPELIESVAGERAVHIVEGEKCAEALWSMGVPATTNAGGAGKWKPELSEHFKDADVVLIPDHDDAGWNHVNQVGFALTGIAKSIRVLVLPGVKPKGDVADWLADGGTRETFDELAAQAPPFVADPLREQRDKATAGEEQLLAQLAAMNAVDYERRRKEAAKELGMRSSILDDEVEKRRTQDRAEAPLFGHWIVEPWPEPVEGDSLLRDIIMRIRRHVVCSHEDALTIALWIMLAWVHNEVATHSPILNINSAEPESGKSTTLGLIGFLLSRCISSVEISEAALYRAIKLWQPSSAIDEFDSVLANDDKVELRSVINSGRTRGQVVVRCVGDEKKPETFSTFCPKAIGMCGRKLPAATLSRCIFIGLRRKRDGEQVERFEHRDDPRLADLRQRLMRWSMDSENALRDVSPSMPGELRNRKGDNWRILLAIADLAGGDWGEQARAAARVIEAGADSRTANVRLLASIQTVFIEIEAKRDEEISSADLIGKLTADPNSEWAEWKYGKPLSQKQLANMLKPYGVAPDKVGDRDVRGYRWWQFEDAWERYL